jgi:hypothetical protein
MYEIRRLTAIDRFVKLFSPVCWLIGAKGLAQVREIHAHDGLRH